MSLGQLYNTPGDGPGMNEFSFANQDHHLQIARAIYSQAGIFIPVYSLDPIHLADPGVFLYQHQQAHNVQNSVLGIQGNDLTDIDLTKRSELEEWILIHFQEHFAAQQILGLTL